MADDARTHELEAAKLQLEMWKQSIEVTQHFNELSHKTRQTGLTAGVGGLALAFALFTQYPAAKTTLVHNGFLYEVHIAGFVLLLAAVAIHVTRHLDIRLHHRMLRGSVAFTQDIERAEPFKTVMAVKRGLAESISYHSRSKVAVSDEDVITPNSKTSAEAKLKKFYTQATIIGVLAAILLFYATFSVTPHELVRINQTIEMPRR